MRRSFRLCVRFASFLLLTAFLLQITAIPIAIAQPTTPNGEPGSARVVPPALAYRPPANANAMRDFAPADAEVKNLPARAGVPAAMPFNEARNSLVTIGNEHVGVFIEENTFNESVSLKFTEADTPRPANPQANEVRGIPAPPITATNTISNPWAIEI